MQLRWILFDWGDTLMSEDGPVNLPMALWPEVRALDGAVETVTLLAARYQLAIATNASVSNREMVLRALERAGLAPHFSSLFCYRDLGVKKAEPGYWQAVVARLGVAPDEILMVGDHLGDDVLAPRAAGVGAIWFNWKGAPTPAGVEVRTIASLKELVPLLL